jgi:hypothetical protein
VILKSANHFSLIAYSRPICGDNPQAESTLKVVGVVLPVLVSAVSAPEPVSFWK